MKYVAYGLVLLVALLPASIATSRRWWRDPAPVEALKKEPTGVVGRIPQKEIDEWADSLKEMRQASLVDEVTLAPVPADARLPPRPLTEYRRLERFRSLLWKWMAAERAPAEERSGLLEKLRAELDALPRDGEVEWLSDQVRSRG